MINPRIMRNTASTSNIKINFSFGLTSTSNPQDSEGIFEVS